MVLKMKKEKIESVKERKDIDYATTLISVAKDNNKKKILASRRNQKLLLKMREKEFNWQMRKSWEEREWRNIVGFKEELNYLSQSKADIGYFGLILGSLHFIELADQTHGKHDFEKQ